MFLAMHRLFDAVSYPIYLLSRKDETTKDVPRPKVKGTDAFRFDDIHPGEPSNFEIYFRTKGQEFRYTLSFDAEGITSESLAKKNVGDGRFRKQACLGSPCRERQALRAAPWQRVRGDAQDDEHGGRVRRRVERRRSLLVYDEQAPKLHPKLLRFIIMLFQDPGINENGAQLIFTSQDVSIMRNNVFRRDEIWFAARNETEASTLWPLSDIHEPNGNLVNKNAAFDRQYLSGRYGADPILDRLLYWEEA